MQLPQYRCHKIVGALKIDKIIHSQSYLDNTVTIYPCEKDYPPFKVSNEYIEKHKPYKGGYYVLYQDGYESFSPPDTFENGYIQIN